METPKPSITNCPFTFLEIRMDDIYFQLERTCWNCLLVSHEYIKRYSGDYGTKVPPLPIPNREVKLRHADGTAYKWESR